MTSFEKRYENQTFEEGSLPSFVRSCIFSFCRFKGKLPSFVGCEFHDCDLSRCKIGELVDCGLFSCNLDGCDFTEADVRFSRTNEGSPCSAKECKWQGIAAIMDCSFFGGLAGDEKSAELFQIMAIVPMTSARKRLMKTFSEELLREVRKRLARDFRTRLK